MPPTFTYNVQTEKRGCLGGLASLFAAILGMLARFILRRVFSIDISMKTKPNRSRQAAPRSPEPPPPPKTQLPVEDADWRPL